MEGLKKLSCSEDAVQYKLYPSIPDTIIEDEYKSFFDDLHQKMFLCVTEITSAYIWQNESFNLRISPLTNIEDAHIFGSTKFGDNVEDEWFIVYLLIELSKHFPGLIAQVSDQDGEFLLIEAADHLPRWLEPDTAENRIFISEGKIHIIPLPRSPAELPFLPSGTPSIQAAVRCVREHSHLTRASSEIQSAILKRIEGFPEKAHALQHNTHCYIPASLAAVLNAAPDLVAPMVQAFYYRDPVDLKACVTFKHFRPGTRVLTQVRMTKCLYAQLMQQQFTADRRSGYPHPARTDPNYTAHDLGIKLAHGAEILCARCGSATSEDKQDASNTKWHAFLQSLTTKGYFKGEIEGSQLYNQLLEEARGFFRDSSSLYSGDPSNPGHRIHALLQTVKYDVEEMRRQEKNLPPPDDDNWLTLSPEQLDDMLTDAYKDAFTKHSSNTPDLSQMAHSMRAFVEQVSSHAGAEFPGSPEDTDVTFDPDSFIHNMQKMFDFKDEKDTSSEDDMSEYGSDIDPDDGDLDRGQNDGGIDMAEMQSYMEQMDRELAKTAIGKSFTQPEDIGKPTPPPRHKKNAKKSNSSSHNAKESVHSHPTDSKAKTTPPQINGTPKKTAPKAALEDDFEDDLDDDDDDFQPVNVDLNLVHNLLESHSSQQGLAGPTSNLLGSMGIKLPHDEGKDVD